MISIDLEVARKIDRTQTLPYPSLGRPGTADVFITAASDLRRIRTARGLARRLTLVDEAGNLD